MSFLIGEIVANVRADSGQFRREMRNVERTGAQSSRSTQRSLGGIGKKLGSLAFLAKTAFTSAMVMGARNAVKEFALLEGAMAKFDVVFGAQAREVEAWVDQFREGVPLARREIIQAAAAMQDLLIPMGVARDDAAEMTKEWLELAAALAAFNDVPVDQALSAIRSGIAGQSRPLRELGIDARETALQQTALAEGMMQAGDQMTDQVRQQALLKRAYDQSKDAVDGYEDQLGTTLMMEQELSAQWKDTMAVIGEELQPAYNELVKTLSNLLTVMNNLSDSALSLKDALSGAFQAQASWQLVAYVKDAINVVSILTSDVGDLNKEWNDFLQTPTDELSVAKVTKQIQILQREMDAMLERRRERGLDTEAVKASEAYQILQGRAAVLGAILQQVSSRSQETAESAEDFARSMERARVAMDRPEDSIIDPSEELAMRMMLEDYKEFNNVLYDVMHSSEDFSHRLQEIEESAKDGTGAAMFFTRTFADGLEQVLFQARSVEDALQNILKQLASRALVTGLGALFGVPMAGGFLGTMFGGFRSSGGSVEAGKAYRFNENNQQEMFIPSTGGQIVSPQQSMGISPMQMERAFLSALDKKLSKLSPEEVFAMGQKGRLSY